LDSDGFGGRRGGFPLEAAVFEGETGVAHVAAGVDEGEEFDGISFEGFAGACFAMFHNGTEVLDFAVVFAGKGFDTGGREVAEGTAEEFLFEEIVPAGKVGELMGDGMAEVGGHVQVFFGEGRGGRRVLSFLDQAMRVGLETPRRREMAAKLRPWTRRRRNW
jgi:hypothetical protein